ncbi:hypothetical protein [Pseudoclavibacter sp. AY1H1]|uniref:hypothetical protein n=1 Tax=Pseudoclavibacter sp. AY1H1 TaxID=2080584 RepID=UPI0011B0963E|nr:hypothetical protein [Pseudoclavibacter sp. AY1H1]
MNPSPEIQAAVLETIARELDPPAWKLHDLELTESTTPAAWLHHVVTPSLQLARAQLTNEMPVEPQQMVTRYTRAVAAHPFGPLTRRESIEISNLAHWRRRANLQ